MTKTFAVGRAGLALSLLLTPLAGCLDDAGPDLGTEEGEAVALPGPTLPRCFGKADVDDFGGVVAAADFDGDGDTDLAVAAYNDNDFRLGAIGAIYVYRRTGTTYAPWSRLSPSSLGLAPSQSTEFGEAMVAADFDNDGRAELAIHQNGPDANGIFPGRVIVVGAGADDTFGVQQIVTQTGLGTDEGGDMFGHHLAVGDFDADGAPDLVVSAAYDDEGGGEWDGRVYIFRGGGAQLTTWKVLTPQTWLMQDAGFGHAIAVGDFDANGYDDLAVGLPSYNNCCSDLAQGVVLTYRSLPGNPLVPSRWIEGRNYVAPSGTTSADFGKTLAAGDFDGDGDDELAIGAPNAIYGSDMQVGAVKIFRNAVGTPSLWHTIQMPFPGANQGKRLAVGNFDGDGDMDLAVGQDPYGAIGSLIIWKGRVGNTPVMWDTYDQALDSLATADLDGDGKTDLLSSPLGGNNPLSFGLGRTTYAPALDQKVYQQAPMCVSYWGAAPVISLRGARQRELDLRITSSGTVDQTFWMRQNGGSSWYEYATVGDRTDTGLTAATQYCYIGKTLQVGSDAYSDTTTTCFNTAAPIAGPTISLTSKTKTSLSVRMVSAGGANQIRSRLQSVSNTTQTNNATTVDRTFSSLTAGTQYCVIADSYHPTTNEWSQERTSCFTTDPATQTGTTPLWLYAQAVPSGPVPFTGSWGPITGARPYRIRVPGTFSGYYLHFLKAGHDSSECTDPDAVVTVEDGGELDAADIATIQGGTPPLGVRVDWVACRSGQPGDNPSSVTVNLDWEKP